MAKEKPTRETFPQFIRRRLSNAVTEISLSGLNPIDRNRYWGISEKFGQDVEKIDQIMLFFIEQKRAIYTGSASWDELDFQMDERLPELQVIKSSLVTHDTALKQLQARYSHIEAIQSLERLHQKYIFGIEMIIQHPLSYLPTLNIAHENLGFPNSQMENSLIDTEISVIEHSILAFKRNKLLKRFNHDEKEDAKIILEEKIKRVIKRLQKVQTELFVNTPDQGLDIQTRLPVTIAYLSYVQREIPNL